jgi:hypothetical protein
MNLQQFYGTFWYAWTEDDAWLYYNWDERLKFVPHVYIVENEHDEPFPFNNWEAATT